MSLIDASAITLGKIIGQGAEGVVRRGRWQGVAVAVKVAYALLDESASGQEALGDLLNEAQLLVRLRHPNIVVLFGMSIKENEREQVVRHNMILRYQ